tara:strand:+ start:1382 stop:2368 length:987 start_codon:yes stop_codon:yes gene_type:complete
MHEIPVPFGINNSGHLIAAQSIQVGGTYTCPYCGEALMCDLSSMQNKMLIHPETNNCISLSDSYKKAKKLIKDVILENKKAETTIQIHQNCYQCLKEIQRDIKYCTFEGVQTDYYYHDSVCDVIGQFSHKGQSIYLGIEIVSEQEQDWRPYSISNGSALRSWIKLKASDVLKEPYNWRPLNSKLSPKLCQSCSNTSKKGSKIIAVADKYSIPRELYTTARKSPGKPFIADIETCYRCSEIIPVFWWLGTPFCEDEPPFPRPYTIELRFSKQYGGKYWANTCPNCKSIQGDNHLHVFETAQFKDLLSPKVKNRESNAISVLMERTKLFY